MSDFVLNVSAEDSYDDTASAGHAEIFNQLSVVSPSSDSEDDMHTPEEKAALAAAYSRVMASMEAKKNRALLYSHCARWHNFVRLGRLEHLLSSSIPAPPPTAPTAADLSAKTSIRSNTLAGFPTVAPTPPPIRNTSLEYQNHQQLLQVVDSLTPCGVPQGAQLFDLSGGPILSGFCLVVEGTLAVYIPDSSTKTSTWTPTTAPLLFSCARRRSCVLLAGDAVARGWRAVAVQELKVLRLGTQRELSTNMEEVLQSRARALEQMCLHLLLPRHTSLNSFLGNSRIAGAGGDPEEMEHEQAREKSVLQMHGISQRFLLEMPPKHARNPRAKIPRAVPRELFDAARLCQSLSSKPASKPQGTMALTEEFSHMVTRTSFAAQLRFLNPTPPPPPTVYGDPHVVCRAAQGPQRTWKGSLILLLILLR